jgi:hypothetical protein
MLFTTEVVVFFLFLKSLVSAPRRRRSAEVVATEQAIKMEV